MLKALAELYRYRDLVQHLVVLDLKVRYRKSILGILWSLLHPLLMMLVLWVVFVRFGRVQEKSYALFLLAGVMMWTFFQQSIDQSLNVIVKNKSLIQKIYVPKLAFPVAVATANLVNLFFFLLAYLGLAAFSSVGLASTLPLIIPVALMLFVLGTGCALMLCSLNVFFRDFTHISGFLLRMLFYLTPIIYRPEMLGPSGAAWLKLNPVYYPVTAARDVLYYATPPAASIWIGGCGFALVAFVLGLFIFTRAESKFVYYA